MRTVPPVAHCFQVRGVPPVARLAREDDSYSCESSSVSCFSDGGGSASGDASARTPRGTAGGLSEGVSSGEADPEDDAASAAAGLLREDGTPEGGLGCGKG